ncbi:MAG: hypothetical protein NVS1B9_09920 [Solirubrobacteraceae bacterium]
MARRLGGARGTGRRAARYRYGPGTSVGVVPGVGHDGCPQVADFDAPAVGGATLG